MMGEHLILKLAEIAGKIVKKLSSHLRDGWERLNRHSHNIAGRKVSRASACWHNKYVTSMCQNIDLSALFPLVNLRCGCLAV